MRLFERFACAASGLGFAAALHVIDFGTTQQVTTERTENFLRQDVKESSTSKTTAAFLWAFKAFAEPVTSTEAQQAHADASLAVATLLTAPVAALTEGMQPTDSATMEQLQSSLISLGLNNLAPW
jgi:hypothetical protein